MATTVSQHQQGVFTTPVDATTAVASVVLSNDNAVRVSYNLHDADPGIHVQSSVLASRPAASSEGRIWMTTNELIDGVTQKLLYYDTGVAWVRLTIRPEDVATGTFTTTAGFTFSGVVTFSSIRSTGVVLIGTGALSASAFLEVRSTTQGFLPPRMTTGERDAIGSPATGLVVYNTTTGVLNFYNGAAWGAV